MKRHILFLKIVQLVNALLATVRCKNEGHFILSCEDTQDNMKILQYACAEVLKGTGYQNYKLCFASPNNYSDFIKYL